MAPVVIESFAPHYEEKWDAYLTTHSNALFYSTCRFRRFLARLLGCDDCSLLSFRDGTPTGVLPLMAMGERDQRVYNSLPFFGTSAGILADDAQSYRRLVEAYNDLAMASGTAAATIIGSQFGEWPEATALVHTHLDSRVAQLTRLPTTSEPRSEILRTIEGSARRNVKKAEAAGVVVETDAGAVETLGALHEARMHDIGGRTKPSAFFRLLPGSFAATRDYEIYIARLSGRPVAALLLFYFNGIAEYYMPAVDPDASDLQPLALVLVEAMTDACRRGIRWWNWGGTWHAQTGVYRFKRKWGADERTYYYRTQLNESRLLTWTAGELEDAFPYFFVVPFSALTTGQTA
jgi:hypothetical protein